MKRRRIDTVERRATRVADCADTPAASAVPDACESGFSSFAQGGESVEELADFLETDLLDGERSVDGTCAVPQGGAEGGEEERAEVPLETQVSRGESTCPPSTEGAPPPAGFLGRLPMELYVHVLKFLSPEDLSTVGTVCRVLRLATADESLWRRLCCLRWGAPGVGERGSQPRVTAWKKLYFQKDTSDMRDFMVNIPPDCPADVRRIFVQFQASKRSQAPCPDQLRDEEVVGRESELAEQISAWRRRHNVTDVCTHVCSGQACSYHKIGDVFLCERTGRAHVCDESCREQVLDPENEMLVCAISGRCFERWLSPQEEDEEEQGRLQVAEGAAMDDQEPLMGAGRLGRAYCLGYDCDDDRELRATQRALGFW